MVLDRDFNRSEQEIEGYRWWALGESEGIV